MVGGALGHKIYKSPAGGGGEPVGKKCAKINCKSTGHRSADTRWKDDLWTRETCQRSHACCSSQTDWAFSVVTLFIFLAPGFNPHSLMHHKLPFMVIHLVFVGTWHMAHTLDPDNAEKGCRDFSAACVHSLGTLNRCFTTCSPPPPPFQLEAGQHLPPPTHNSVQRGGGGELSYSLSQYVFLQCPVSGFASCYFPLFNNLIIGSSFCSVLL